MGPQGRYRVCIHIFYNLHPVHILSSVIDLSRNPHLRFLRFYLRLEHDRTPDTVVQWFNSICESVTSSSLVVEVHGFRRNLKICSEIEDMLLALYERVKISHIYMTGLRLEEDGVVRKDDIPNLFPRLYELGIVIQKRLNANEAVSRYFITSVQITMLSTVVFRARLLSVDNLPLRSFLLPNIPTVFMTI